MIVIDIAHEALIRHWPRLREWVNEDRDFKTWRDRFGADVKKWLINNQHEAWLLRGAHLVEPEKWLKERADDLTADENNYINASIAERERARQEQEALLQREKEARENEIQALKERDVIREQEIATREQARQEKERSQRRFTKFLSIGLVVALGLATIAGWQWWESQQNFKAEQIAKQKAENLANQLVRNEFFRLSELAQKEYEQHNITNAYLLALEALSQFRNIVVPDRNILKSKDNLIKTIKGLYEHLVLRHPFPMLHAAFHPYGEYIATTSKNTVYLWNINQNKLIMVLQHGYQDNIAGVTFNSEGTQIITGFNNSNYFWDIDNGQLLTNENKPISSYISIGIATLNISFDLPSGGVLFDRSEDKFFGDKELIVRRDEPNTLYIKESLSFMEQQNFIDIDQQRASWTPIKGHEDTINYAVFAPDGHKIVTVSQDSTVRLWSWSWFYHSDEELNILQHAPIEKLMNSINQMIPRCFTNTQREQFLLLKSESQPFIEKGTELAQAGQIDEATAQFQKAQELERCHKFEPEDKARQLAAEAMIKKAETLAEQGQIDAAVAKFQQAQKVDPRFKFADNLENYAQQIAGQK